MSLHPLSAIVITKNEERNIERCLRSLSWLEEVVLVDSGSSDRTVEIAKSFPNTRVIQHEWLGYSATKSLAVSYTKHNWVLWVDADEEITAPLKEELLSLKTETADVYAYSIPRKTFFMGEWIRYCGWYPGRVVRLFNKNYCRFNDKILHEGLDVQDNKTGALTADLNHFSYLSLYQYFDKMNQYGKYGAEELNRRGKKFQFYQLILNPLTTFIKFYFLKKGFLDGTKGFIICAGSSFSNFIKYANFYYLQKKKQ